jgi:hypothetical protein
MINTVDIPIRLLRKDNWISLIIESQTNKGEGGNGCTAPCILNLGTRCGWSASCLTALFSAEGPVIPIGRRPISPQSPSGWFGKEKSFWQESKADLSVVNLCSCSKLVKIEQL